ncbi:UNVERIFIED_CONTAM: Retrovirus-related Pol polyprotein from transposon TNT 1-94 [Sesamum latifolium]|uniref:Retrovirus-related Pol polyprotein from transposon TNT 1-94 n=1 Tax=Sesamum latifolium TaxID=2727402 RepID=A0AAW2WX66_9LAMI
MKIWLTMKELLTVIQVTRPEPIDTYPRTAEIEQWTERDQISPEAILSALSNTLFDVYCSDSYTAKSLWDELDRKYNTEDQGLEKYSVSKFMRYQMVGQKGRLSLDDLVIAISIEEEHRNQTHKMPVEHHPRANLIVGKQKVNKVNSNLIAINKGKATKNKKSKANKPCWNYGQVGHWAKLCPNKKAKTWQAVVNMVVGGSSSASTLGATEGYVSVQPELLTIYELCDWLIDTGANVHYGGNCANVMFLTTAKDMWDALHDMYSHAKNISRVFELYEKLFSLKKDGRAILDYFASLKGTADEILLYHPLSCDAQTRKTQWEDFLVAKFLSGVDSNLKVVHDHLLGNDSVSTLSNALSRVLCVATGSFESFSSSGTSIESSAMAVRGRGRSSSRGRGGRGRISNTSTNSRYCTHCGRTNHVVEKFWIKYGKPKWANTVNSGGEPAALEPSPNQSKVVTFHEQLLHHPVANSATPATASSPSALLHLTDLQTRRMIGGGHERGGLYFLDTSTPVDARDLSASVSPLQWHCRPRHPSLPSLKKVLPIESSRLDCESCELGKHHRASFPPRIDKRSSSPFTLVHSDIWGPCRLESIAGFGYFITFVVDYSRMTWVYLLKDRSQVPTIITSFYNEIKTQFFVSICTLRTDNALEFVQKAVSNFCDSKEILHQTSCLYTSQQIGVAKRKHRHLLDVARTIMTHMHVPKSYWGDAILTACYLINRMPSSVLSGDTPYSCLFP